MEIKGFLKQPYLNTECWVSGKIKKAPTACGGEQFVPMWVEAVVPGHPPSLNACVLMRYPSSPMPVSDASELYVGQRVKVEVRVPEIFIPVDAIETMKQQMDGGEGYFTLPENCKYGNKFYDAIISNIVKDGRKRKDGRVVEVKFVGKVLDMVLSHCQVEKKFPLDRIYKIMDEQYVVQQHKLVHEQTLPWLMDFLDGEEIASSNVVIEEVYEKEEKNGNEPLEPPALNDSDQDELLDSGHALPSGTFKDTKQTPKRKAKAITRPTKSPAQKQTKTQKPTESAANKTRSAQTKTKSAQTKTTKNNPPKKGVTREEETKHHHSGKSLEESGGKLILSIQLTSINGMGVERRHTHTIEKPKHHELDKVVQAFTENIASLSEEFSAYGEKPDVLIRTSLQRPSKKKNKV